MMSVDVMPPRYLKNTVTLDVKMNLGMRPQAHSQCFLRITMTVTNGCRSPASS